MFKKLIDTIKIEVD